MGRSDGFTLITGELLIDGTGAPPVPQGAVLIQGTKIVAVGRRDEVRAPEGAAVQAYHYPGKAIMPGMVDCHTHHNGFGDGRPGDDLATIPDEVLTLQSARNARASLFTGVTTIRENGPKNMTMFRLRDAVNQGIVVGPRMVLCGRPVAIIGGHMGYFGTEVTGPVECRAAVRQLIKEGADYIKITATGGTTRTSYPLRPSFTVEELRAMVDEAHKFGKLTAAHCASTQGTINCLEAGVDMIIHCFFREPDGSAVFREEVAERIACQGAFVNPTLHINRSQVWTYELKGQREGLTPHEQGELDRARRSFETLLEHTSRLIDMGLKIITGSDSSWRHYKLGNTVYEVECLVMAGYSPMQALVSVTGQAAKALDMDHLVGTLEPGKEADIIVVDGNPAEDIKALWRVEEVFLAGRRVERGPAEEVAAFRQPAGVSYLL